MDRHDHKTVAELTLSCEDARIGWIENDDCLWLKMHQQPDCAYMSVLEAEMLISALKVAVSKVKGDR